MRNLRLISFLLALLISVLSFSACSEIFPDETSVQAEETTADGTADSGEPVECYINGVSIDQYTIVYSAEDADYSKRAARYIQEQILERTAVSLTLAEDSKEPFAHEIVVGETSREISDTLDADTESLEFAILADDAHIALEADYFVIAAAAYFFVETYVTGANFDTVVPKEVSVHEPIVKEAKNFILLVGDGMGVNQTRLFEAFDVATEGDEAYSDGEDLFYGYMLPYYGLARTTSLSGVTDSAAGGTALATGYKTVNSRVGRDKDYNDIQSLTELAGSLGKATAVMSTDSVDGATPSAFSAHANDRNDKDVIKESQAALKKAYNTIIDCGYNKYNQLGIQTLEYRIKKALEKMSSDEDGFFIMYEEAHIDKYCHNSELEKTFDALVRFNQAIGVFMEFAFYHPDTFLLITADHETGGLQISADGEFSYTSAQNSGGSRNHTGAAVPVFAYGMGAEMFNGTTVENVEIPKQIAKLWGVDSFGGPISPIDYFT